MNIRCTCRILAVAALFAGLPATAEDIELFVNANPQSTPPNVLFVIDTAANFSSSAPGNECRLPNNDSPRTLLSGRVGGIEQCALYRVINSLPEESVNIGVMMYNTAGIFMSNGTECPRIVSDRPGGCLVHPITFMDSEGKRALLDWILSWRIDAAGPGNVKGDRQNTGGVMQEAWAYFNGRQGLSGKPYADIVPDAACNNYVIFIGNSFAAAGSPADQAGSKGPKDALIGLNPNALMNASPAATAAQRAEFTPTIATACGTVTLGQPHENNGYYADEWARYMNADGITTYSIGLLKTGGRNDCQAPYAGILTTMAELGGGKYFPTTNYAELVIAIQTALSEMLSVNSVFASVSLPVSVNTEGTYLNQVFIGMFRPDGDAMPRWHGNLKQYRLGRVDDELRLLDAQTPGRPAISSAGTGFVSSCARSYWTPTTADTYWAEMGETNCAVDDPDNPDDAVYDARSNTPDGNIVEKGAQGYVLRGLPDATSISRNIKTCTAGCGGLANFDTSNAAITASALGVTAAERDSVINWGRGLNNKVGEDIWVASTAMRPSVHGDVVHSRPVAINFEPVDANPPQVAVFYGGNDGVLRAVNGNRDRNFGTVPPGQEIWSFVAPEFYPYIDRLRKNNRQIDFEPGDPDRKPYGFDGAVTAYAERDTDPVWIFSTMRRGGRAVYAFDVTGIDENPPDVDLMWKFGCSSSSDTTCTTGATEMGQSWAAPKVIRAMGFGDGLAPMLIMGGGYDDCEDYDPDTCSGTNKGNIVYLLNARTGAILKTFNTDRGVVGDVTIVTAPHPDPDNHPGIRVAVWAYLADLGGNIYRISGATANSAIENALPGDWTITKIASLGCSNTTVCDNNRKFFFGADVVYDAITATYVLLVGSGDREKPVYRYEETEPYDGAYGVDNYFFSLRDKPTDSTWLAAEATRCGGNSLICLDSLLQIDWNDPTPSDSDLVSKPRGWALGMRDHEQVVTSAITVFGITTFSTHIPMPEPTDDDTELVCTNDLGTASVYNIGFSNAAPPRGIENRFQEVDGGGLPPSPVAGQVELDTGEVVPFIIGGNPRSALEGSLPSAPARSTRPKSLTYWYIER